ncbi:MAG: hypothetical protein CVU39_01920 [Chloroflexi bacterium HGW-Chloroflexi-10]|nr:MAG: hypothetical protein CVU39_01920 [Chloroflexi bacterium HGW-Chloroflexi-10]
MNKIIFITHFKPSPIGHGGNHRSYQIFQDFSKIDEYHLEVLYIPLFSHELTNKKSVFLRKLINFLFRILSRFSNIIFSIVFLGNIHYLTKYQKLIDNLGWKIKFFKEICEFKKWASKKSNKKICIIDHPYYECFLNICKRNHVFSIATPHNLESLDTFNFSQPLYSIKTPPNIQFEVEISFLSKCNSCFMISKIESNICQGVGLKTFYYPYFPVGEIKNEMENVKTMRSSQVIQNGIFLLMGSFNHQPTREGIRWFLENLIPRIEMLKGLKNIYIAGSGTENIHKMFPDLPEKIKCLGWIEQKEFLNLLTNCTGIIIPHHQGFGAITRISEFACAGIPIVSSKHPTEAIDIPPGVIFAENSWNDWEEKLSRILNNSLELKSQAKLYHQWEETQQEKQIEIFSSFK